MAAREVSQRSEPFRAVQASQTPQKKDAFFAFATPQVPKGYRSPTYRRCWSSGRRRPSFLDDSSGSEDEVKSPVQRSSPSPCVAGTPFSKDEDAWFLESLSESVPLENCRPDTIRFRRNFRKSREDLTKALFSIFNKEVFAGKLAQEDICWNGRLTSTAGRCFCLKESRYRVELSPKLLDCAEKTRDTLLHELCHAAVWCLYGCKGGHGYTWKFWVDRAARRFPRIPPVTRCHDYKQVRLKLSFKDLHSEEGTLGMPDVH
ncbi:germ cell nuclear acidic protein-like [Amblyomma americanum]